MCSFLSPLPEKATPLITPGEMGFFGRLSDTWAGWPYNLRFKKCYAICKVGLS